MIADSDHRVGFVRQPGQKQFSPICNRHPVRSVRVGIDGRGMPACAGVHEQPESFRRGLRTGKCRNRPRVAERSAGGVFENQLIGLFRLQPREVERVELAGRIDAHTSCRPRARSKRWRRGHRAHEAGLEQQAIVADPWKQVPHSARLPVLFLRAACDGEGSRSCDRGREKLPPGKRCRHGVKYG